MKRLSVILFIIIGCSSKKSAEQTSASVPQDSISIVFNSSTFTRKDTFLKHPDGKERVFRKLILLNQSKFSVYLGKLDDGNKFLYDRINAYYDRLSKKWIENHGWGCGFPVIGNYKINSGKFDTIIVDDPFRNYDSISYQYSYYSDSSFGKRVNIINHFGKPR
jgi:hypothetical protein